jgi:aldose 1-epimerase
VTLEQRRDPSGMDGARIVPLSSDCGVDASILNYGATIRSLRAPGRDGERRELVLGFQTLPQYLTRDNHYLGATIGRHANRIRGGLIQTGCTRYALTKNEGENHVHGGVDGFSRKVWRVDEASSSSVALTYTSPDGEEGYPGAVDVEVRYSLTGNVLRIDYRATSDAETYVSLTNHALFNLSGDCAEQILEHELTLFADFYTPVGPGLIPTGEIASVVETPFDFRSPRPIGERIASDHPQLKRCLGYDHNYVLRRSSSDDLAPAAVLHDPRSGRVLELRTNQPGLQLYSGNRLDGTLLGPRGTPLGRFAGVALEAQGFPDSPNQPHFPSTLLRAGESYSKSIELVLSVE